MSRIIDADALENELVYIDGIPAVTELDIDSAPTIDAIPVAWLCEYSGNHYDATGREVTVLEALRQWKKENGDG